MILSLKTKPTNKKFYNKWLYKTSLRIPGCAVLRSSSLLEVKEFCSKETINQGDHYPYWQKAWHNREQIGSLVDFLSTQDISNYCTRIERNTIDVYTNDKKFYDDISTLCQTAVIQRFEPSEKTLDILNDDKNCIVVDKLPKGRYNFRVYLLPHKMAFDKEEKQKYVNWLKNQSPKITCTDAVEQWFIKTDWNWDRRYVLVEDEATLLMLKLRNSEVVGRVYNFIISDK